MPQKSKPEFTESMIEFGRFMKFLRCPDIHSFKLKVLEKGKSKLGAKGTAYLESDVGLVNDLFADEDLPDNFRDLQLKAKRYKVKMYSLREISEIMDISKNTLHDYERGKRYPPVEFIYDYCEVLRIPVNSVLEHWLLNHPNENISIHTEETLEKHFCHQLSSHYHDEGRMQAREFFKTALKYSLSRSKVYDLYELEVVKISNAMVNIIDKTLAHGLSLEPKNVYKADMILLSKRIKSINL